MPTQRRTMEKSFWKKTMMIKISCRSKLIIYTIDFRKIYQKSSIFSFVTVTGTFCFFRLPIILVLAWLQVLRVLIPFAPKTFFPLLSRWGFFVFGVVQSFIRFLSPHFFYFFQMQFVILIWALDLLQKMLNTLYFMVQYIFLAIGPRHRWAWHFLHWGNCI